MGTISITPARFDFRIWKGATFRKTITIYQGGVGSPLRDLSGYSANCDIKDKVGAGASVLLPLSTANGGIILGQDLGILQLYISATDTAAITWTLGHYVLSITAPGGDTDAILFGVFNPRSQ